MSHDRLTKIDKISVRGDGLLLTGSADIPDGHIRTLLLDNISLARTKGHGTIHLGANEPIAVVLQGDQIDLSSKLTEKTSGPDKPDAAQVTSPDWTFDARFDHAILANGERAGDGEISQRHFAGGGRTRTIGLDARPFRRHLRGRVRRFMPLGIAVAYRRRLLLI